MDVKQITKERKVFLAPKLASEAVSDHWVSKMLSRTHSIKDVYTSAYEEWKSQVSSYLVQAVLIKFMVATMQTGNNLNLADQVAPFPLMNMMALGT